VCSSDLIGCAGTKALRPGLMYILIAKVLF
jgi:hypothetical protein